MLTSISIIVEWETVLLGGRARAICGLHSINRQLWSLPDPSVAAPELIVCFDSAEATEESVRAALKEASGTLGWPGRVLVAAVPSENRGYYQKKNFGFSLSQNDIVVFVDSDLVPEQDWLVNLVAAFGDFRKSVIVGRTHLETRTLYERAVALFWIFDVRDSSFEVRLTDRLVSNNVAFRRQLFGRLPFPARPTFRGQCGELAVMLAARRIPIWEHPGARACHPAPEGVQQFFARAFHAGRDQCFYDRLSRAASTRQCARQWMKDLGTVARRTRERRRDVGAKWPSIGLSLSLGFAYYSSKAMAYLAYLRGPQQAAR